MTRNGSGLPEVETVRAHRGRGPSIKAGRATKNSTKAPPACDFYSPIPHVSSAQAPGTDINDWTVLRSGAAVQIFAEDKELTTGQVDEVMPDGSLIWVFCDNDGLRHIFHKAAFSIKLLATEGSQSASEDGVPPSALF